MATVSDLITAALKEIMVLAEGETASSGQANDALGSLNRMLDQWAAERLIIPFRARTSWNITANDGDYSVGTGADVSVLRPAYIDEVRFIDTSTTPDTEYPLRKMFDQEYAAIAQKPLTSKYPEAWWYNPTYANGTLILWPTPTSTTLQGVLYHPVALGYPAALTTTVNVPPGYEELMVTGLAVRLCAQFGREPSADMRERVRHARSVVEGVNLRPMEMSVGGDGMFGRHGYFNVKTGV